MTYTTYADATQHFQKILCNNICEIDPDVYENMSENFYDYWNDNEPNHQPDSDDYEYPEIFQYYLTNLNQEVADYLMKRFNLLFMYSPKLDMQVLCVPHYGTAWIGVDWVDRGTEE